MKSGPPLPTDERDRLPPETRALILTLQPEVTELRAKVHEQQRHIEALRQRLNQNSTNSSRPPSSDPPTVKRRPQVSSQDQERRCGGSPTHVSARQNPPHER
jgi:transposase